MFLPIIWFDYTCLYLKSLDNKANTIFCQLELRKLTAAILSDLEAIKFPT